MASSKKAVEAAAAASELVTTQPNELAVPDYIKQGSGRGNEEVKSSDMVLPRLELIQALSPIKDENPNAREGQLFNSVTQEIIGDSAFFVPIYFRMEYLVWQDNDAGGGFHGSYPTLDQAMEKRDEVVAADPKLAGKNTKGIDLVEVVDTPVHYGLRITPEGVCEQIVISMAKTKAKISRKWNAMIQIAGGDRFSRVYKISSLTDENKKGQKFKNFVVQPAGYPPEPVYREAERLYQSFRSGLINADHASVVPEDDTSTVDRHGV